MTIRVECPHCQHLSDAASSLGGKTARCPDCNQILQVPIPAARQVAETPAASPPLEKTDSPPFLVIERPTKRMTRNGRTRNWSLFFRNAVYLSMSAASMYGGWYYLQAQLQQIEEARPVPRKMETAPVPSRHVTPKQQMQPRPEVFLATPRTKPAEPAVAPAPPPSPLVELPKHVSLPHVDDKTVHTLASINAPTSLSLVTISPQLTLNNDRLLWLIEDAPKPITIGGLAFRDGEILFRWLETVPKESETAIWNSLIEVTVENEKAHIALRSSEIVEPLSFDLKRPILRIVCECKHLPPPDAIHFDLIDTDKLPPFAPGSESLRNITLRQEITLRFVEADGIETKLSLIKRGKLAVAEFRSVFQLPSGSNTPLSVSNGTKRLKELEKLVNLARNASNQLISLQTRVANLKNELSRLGRLDTTVETFTGKRVVSPELVSSKNLAYNNTRRSLAKAESRLAKANRLIADLPALEREVKALQAISVVAEKLHNTKNLRYRFFTLVEGREVDLIVAGEAL